MHEEAKPSPHADKRKTSLHIINPALEEFCCYAVFTALHSNSLLFTHSSGCSAASFLLHPRKRSAVGWITQKRGSYGAAEVNSSPTCLGQEAAKEGKKDGRKEGRDARLLGFWFSLCSSPPTGEATKITSSMGSEHIRACLGHVCNSWSRSATTRIASRAQTGGKEVNQFLGLAGNRTDIPPVFRTQPPRGQTFDRRHTHCSAV